MAAQPSDDVNFASILESMGIQNYDSRVITALNEYARRYAGDLLSDAMDYAHHADRQEIELEDIQIAVKLSDGRTLGLDPRQRVLHLIESDINTGDNRDLLKLLNKDAVLNRYPPHAYQQRCFSYIPGIEAFPEVVENEDPGSENTGADVVNATKKRTASISFHPSLSTENDKEMGDGEPKKIRFQQSTLSVKDRSTLDPVEGFQRTNSTEN